MVNQKPVVLIIGMGSIASRHKSILKDKGYQVYMVSRRGNGDYISIKEALNNNSFCIAVIATETSMHLHNLNDLTNNGFEGLIVIEKPLFGHGCPELQNNSQQEIFVAYNLRFSPLIQAFKQTLEKSSDRVLSAHLYVGQHLSQWREGREIKDVYSSRSELGGGVLRDLSHELDLALYLFGPVSAVKAIGGRCSEITVDADDAWSIISQHDKCQQITINLNYFDRPARRFIHANTESATITADLIENSLVINGNKTNYSIEPDTSYVSMWEGVNDYLQGRDNEILCTYEQGIEVMKYIQTCESSALSV